MFWEWGDVLSLIGGIRYQGVSGTAVESESGRIFNFVGFPLSGQADSNSIAVCMYDYDYTNGQWVPATHT